MKNLIRIFLTSLTFLLFAISGIAQGEFLLFVDGTVKEGKEKLDGAKVTLLVDGTYDANMETDGSGKFAFDLEMDHEYILEFAKPGFVTKKISISTKGVPAEEAEFGFEFGGWQVGLFKEIEGLDVSALDKPVGKISYNSDIGGFDYDAKYTKSVQRELQALQAELEEKQEEQKHLDHNYDVAISAADKAFSTEHWEHAKEKYDEAIALKPKEQYPKDKLAEITSKIAALEQANAEQAAKEKQFTDLITSADTKLGKNELESAKADYQAALEVKAGDKHAVAKIQEIDQKIKEQQDALAAEKAKTEEYNALITSADSKLKSDDLEGAKTEYLNAQKVKPDETYPQTKLDEIEAKIKEQEAKEQELAEKEKAYTAEISKADNLFKANDYEAAKSSYQSALSIKAGETYPTNRIQEIETKLAEIAENIAAEASKKNEFDNLISKADNDFDTDNLDAAKNGYTAALLLFPNEKHPTSRLKEIESKIAAQAEEEAKRLAEEEAAKKAKEEEEKKLAEANAAEEAKRLAEEEAAKKAKEEEEKKLAEANAAEEAKRLAEAEAARKAKEEEEKKLAEANAAEEAKRLAEEEAAKKAKEEEEKQLAEANAAEEAKRLAEEEAARKAKEEEEKKRAEANAAEEAKRLAEEEAAKKAKEEEEKKLAEAQRAQEEEERRQAEAQLAQETKTEEIKEPVKPSGASYHDLLDSGDLLYGFKKFKEAREKYVLAHAARPTEHHAKDRIAQIDAYLSRMGLQEEHSHDKPIDTHLPTEDFKNEIAKKYPEGVTEEIIKENNKTITMRYVVRGNHGDEYKMIKHNYGAKFFFKNGVDITELIWNKETQK